MFPQKVRYGNVEYEVFSVGIDVGTAQKMYTISLRSRRVLALSDLRSDEDVREDPSYAWKEQQTYYGFGGRWYAEDRETHLYKPMSERLDTIFMRFFIQ